MKTKNRSRSGMARIALGSTIYFSAVAFALAQGANSSARTFRQVTISPDGTHVAWVESLATGAGGSAIYVQDLESSGSQPWRLSAASEGSTAQEGDVSWSPDSKRLAFLSDAAGDKQSALYVADRDGSAARKLT